MKIHHLTLATSALLAGVCHAQLVFDIGTASTEPFDQALGDSLSNVGNLVIWDTQTGFNPVNDSDFTDVDIASLNDLTGINASGWTGAGQVDYSGVNFSGLTISNTVNNFARGDNFTGADFTNTVFTISGNQPFLFSTVVDADFSGAVFNYTPFDNGSQRINFLRGGDDGTFSGDYSGADFSNTVWNITLTGNALAANPAVDPTNVNIGMFAASATSADFSGADFNFSGDTSEAVSIAQDIIIVNLGSAGTTYDDAFLTNNFAEFGYDTPNELEAALISAGWSNDEVVAPIFWTGTAGSIWDSSTTANFATNFANEPLDIVTFSTALADSLSVVTFGDQYFSSDPGSPFAVAETVVTIADAGVSAPINGIEFTNTSLDYEIGTSGTLGITGDTDVDITGGGTVTLTSPNTHSGETTVNGDSSLLLTDGLSLQNSVVRNDATLIFDDSVTGNAFTFGGLAGSGPLVLENDATSPQAIALTLGNDEGFTFSNNLISGSGELIKNGSVAMTLAGENTYSGGTTVNAGTLVTDNDSAYGSGAIELAGGTLDTNGSHTIANDIEVTGSARINADSNFFLDGSISGEGTLNTGGPGSGNATLILRETDLSEFSGNFSYTNSGTSGATGGNNVNLLAVVDTEASFEVNASDASGRYLRFFEGGTIGQLSGDGRFIINSERTLTIDQDTDSIFSGVIGLGTNDGGITKVGSGTLTLSGASIYRNATTISEGILSAENNKALGNTTLVTVNGGTLEVAGLSVGDLTLGTDASLGLSTGTIALDLGPVSDQIVSDGDGGSFTITGGTLELFLADDFDYGATYPVLVGFGDSNSVTGLSITGFDTANFSASLGTNGILSFSPLGATPYGAWTGRTFANPFTNTDPLVDFDLDGLSNLLEFVLGGDPTISEAGVVPCATSAIDGTLVVTFSRSDISELAPAVAVTVQVSSDLTFSTPANDIVIGAVDGSGPNEASYTVTPDGSGLDTIVVTIPGGGDKNFARVVAVQP